MFPRKLQLILFAALLCAVGCQKDNELIQDIEATEEKAILEKMNSEEVTEESVLVFYKTASFKHTSIAKGIETLEALALANSFLLESTDDSALFTTENLQNYDLVIFLNTTGDILNDTQQEVFENYIQSGGNFMGVHSACDTEYDWPWYGELVGAYFLSHPEIQEATIDVVNNTHEATNHLSDSWELTDEWYDFKEISPNVSVLLNLDEATYVGGANGENHPIAWYQEYDGGRSFYTGIGHNEEVYDLSDFKEHLLGGIAYCLER
ncbi:ThuA domain-containing protein [Aurantibacter sp.]|uniref:ThuA domain-containing protein n=1 Tax=Aurantibacter sp. TaxID=2807103 RepID=UPI003264F490